MHPKMLMAIGFVIYFISILFYSSLLFETGTKVYYIVLLSIVNVLGLSLFWVSFIALEMKGIKRQLEGNAK